MDIIKHKNPLSGKCVTGSDLKSDVYLMDCMGFIKDVPNKYFDLAVVDPLYGIGESGAKNYTRGKLAKAKNYKAFHGNDQFSPELEYFKELFRTSKNQIIWGANHFVEKIPYNSSCWIVWDKDNGETDFADCELAWTSYKSTVRIFKYKWQGMLQQNMKNKEIRIHPTQKPVALYAWIYKNYAKPGMKILDTHLGSQSNRIAALEAGMHFTGIELDKDYFNEGNKRFEHHVSQIRML